MNIAVNARLLLSENMEGVARYTYETTRHMAQQHPEDSFILFYDRNVAAEFDFPHNVIKVVVPWQARHPILWHIYFEYLIPFYFKKYKIDVFYTGEGYMSLSTKVPTVLVTHDLAYQHYPNHIPSLALKHYQYFIPKYHDKAASIITVSSYVKSDIINCFGTTPDKIHVAYNAVNDFIPSQNDKPINLKGIVNSPYFVYVGSLHPRKNIVRLIEAFDTFMEGSKSEYKLILAGRLAWKSDEIKTKIQASPNVIHLGEVSESTKYQLIGGAMAMVYVSLFEGFGIPILEAMKVGVPVITSSVTSMPEVAGNAAITVDPTNVQQIAASLDLIANNEQLRQELVRKGNERCKKFDWNKSSDIIYNELKSSFLLQNKNQKS